MVSSNNNHAPIMQLERVAKRYGGLEALAPLSLTIHRSETVAVLGPSGSGKTTLLLLMCGALQPSGGCVQLDGRDLVEMRSGRELARLVGMIHQQFDLVSNLSALHNVLVGRLGEWGLAKSLLSLLWPRDRQLGLTALDRLGVADRAYVRAGRLSGGEQQRVAIARVMIQAPEMILADEPVASLDPARAEEVLGLLVGIARERGTALLASIHSVELARKQFSRLVGLRNGVLAFDIPSEQVSDAMIRDLYDLRALRREA